MAKFNIDIPLSIEPRQIKIFDLTLEGHFRPLSLHRQHLIFFIILAIFQFPTFELWNAVNNEMIWKLNIMIISCNLTWLCFWHPQTLGFAWIQRYDFSDHPSTIHGKSLQQIGSFVIVYDHWLFVDTNIREYTYIL